MNALKYVCILILLGVIQLSVAQKKQLPKVEKKISKELKIKKQPKTLPNYQAPGVYVEEIQTSTNQIAQTESSVVGFIGYTQIIPDGEQYVPKKIRSLFEYVTFFGEKPVAADGDFYLADAIELFFANGGKNCYITSTGTYTDEPELGNSASTGLLKSLAAQESIKEISILVAPDAVLLNSANQAALYQAMLSQCNTLKNRFSIFDILETDNGLQQDVEDFRTAIGTNLLQYGAAYTPWITSLSGKNIPPSGAIAGIYSSVDDARGVWKAPANVSVNHVSGLTRTISNSEQELLNIDSTSGKSVNAIRSFTSRGILVWGARTLAGNDNDWRYVPIKRLANVLEHSIGDHLESIASSPNESATWNSLKSSVENYLTQLWRDGAFQGSTSEKAFYVKVGLGETMTQTDIDNENLVLEIGIAPVRPAEFIILQFNQTMD